METIVTTDLIKAAQLSLEQSVDDAIRKFEDRVHKKAVVSDLSVVRQEYSNGDSDLVITKAEIKLT